MPHQLKHWKRAILSLAVFSIVSTTLGVPLVHATTSNIQSAVTTGIMSLPSKTQEDEPGGAGVNPARTSDHIQPQSLKPRVVFTGDIGYKWDQDDEQTLVHMLVYADQLEIEAIIADNGFNYTDPDSMEIGLARTREIVRDGYARDLPNLLKRSGQKDFMDDESRQSMGYWPSAKYLEERIFPGRYPGTMQHIGDNDSSEGTDFLYDLMLEEDPRPLYVFAGGGPDAFAQALWDLTRNPARKVSSETMRRVWDNVWIIPVGDQSLKWRDERPVDHPDNAGHWLRTIPELKNYIRVSRAVRGIKEATVPLESGEPGFGDWIPRNIRDRGNLGRFYIRRREPLKGVEGDSPALLMLLPNGLHEPRRPDWGGWGGVYRFDLYDRDPVRPVWVDADGSGELPHRYVMDVFENFAGRLDWAADGQGNRNPLAIIDGDAGWHVMSRQAHPGDIVVLDAAESHDPDGGPVSYSWEVLEYPVHAVKEDAIDLNIKGSHLQLTVPSNAGGKEIHLLLTVSDSGKPRPLRAYRRVVLAVDHEPFDTQKGYRWSSVQ